MPLAGQIHVLKDSKGNPIFPITIPKAISDLNGTHLGDGSITVEKLSPAVVNMINGSPAVATKVIDCGDFEDSSIMLEFDCGTF